LSTMRTAGHSAPASPVQLPDRQDRGHSAS
jgi:hypothetical protein